MSIGFVFSSSCDRDVHWRFVAGYKLSIDSIKCHMLFVISMRFDRPGICYHHICLRWLSLDVCQFRLTIKCNGFSSFLPKTKTFALVRAIDGNSFFHCHQSTKQQWSEAKRSQFSCRANFCVDKKILMIVGATFGPYLYVWTRTTLLAEVHLFILIQSIIERTRAATRKKKLVPHNI